MKTYRIASIPGDGIGIEVVAAGLRVLEALVERDGGFRPEVETFDWGSERYKRDGALMPEDGAERLRDFDAIFFGAVGAPDVPDHLTLWGLRLAICQPLDQYANVRPTRILPFEAVTADPDLHTPDLAGTATTDRVTEAVIAAIRGRND